MEVDGDGLNEAANFKLDTLLQLFPQGDFGFLRNKCIELAADDSGFEAFVNEALTTSGVPSRGEGPSDTDQVANVPDLMVPAFDVEKFVETLPDPIDYFENLIRSDNHKTQAYEFLKDRFRDVKSSFIEHIVVEQGYNLLRASQFLTDIPPHAIRLEPRQDSDINLTPPLDPNFQKEVLLFDHIDEVQAYVKLLGELKRTAIEEGQVFECECCYSDDILPSETIMCTEAHIFCRDCVKRSTAVRIGDGLVTFPCLCNCASGGVIPLESIKTVLDSNSYNKVVARIQEEEVRQADIPGIEYCQRCEYAAIPDENIIIFKCPKCDFELCRLCNRESHVPRKCGESVEEDNEKQHRKKNEEFLTTKVLRRCGGCKKPYVKTSGCDKVTCSCGTNNCYRCGASGIDYPHIDSCRGGFDPLPEQY
uniref:RING-type domain-containing protein n=1 Tax=Lygus hesperus TaxID=30085 RepID=A0A0A9W441_LYGHE